MLHKLWKTLKSNAKKLYRKIFKIPVLIEADWWNSTSSQHPLNFNEYLLTLSQEEQEQWMKFKRLTNQTYLDNWAANLPAAQDPFVD